MHFGKCMHISMYICVYVHACMCTYILSRKIGESINSYYKIKIDSANNQLPQVKMNQIIIILK